MRSFAALFLLWLAFIPRINNLGQVLVIVVLGCLAVVGVEILRPADGAGVSARPWRILSKRVKTSVTH